MHYTIAIGLMLFGWGIGGYEETAADATGTAALPQAAGTAALTQAGGTAALSQAAGMMDFPQAGGTAAFPQAGATVTAEMVAALGGVDKWFAAEPIPDDVWARMQGKSYQTNRFIGREELRHVRALHWDYDEQTHVGEMICNRLIADRVVGILRKLYDAHYPIQRMVLPDEYDADDERQMRANNSSCFCYRPIAGTGTLSKHARGLAVDLNTLYNPYYRDRADGTRYVQPATATAYCDRSRAFPYKIERGDLCYRLFTEAGFAWGGDWTSCKDFQHFEFIEDARVRRSASRKDR